MAGAEPLRHRANAAAALLALATFLRARALEVMLTGIAADSWLLQRARSRPLQINVGRATDSVLLPRLHQAAVHRRAARFARRIAAEERPRRVGDLQRFAGWADRRQ